MRRLLCLIFGLTFCITAHADTINVNWFVDGNTYDTSTCTVGGDLILPTPPTPETGYHFVGWEVANYAKLEYIESTGTQYIDTNITGSTNAIIDMQGTSRSNEVVVFMLAPINATLYQNGFGQYKNQISGDGNIDITTRKVYNVSYTSSSLTVNNVYTNYYIENNIDLALFGSTATNRRIANAKLYSAKIYNNDTLLRNFVPVKRNTDGAIGLYDLVSRQFFTNAGTGVFIAGPETGEWF